MCRHVKSIEIIEFGYEKSARGRQRRQERILRRQAPAVDHAPVPGGAARGHARRTAVDGLRALHDLWLKALAEPQVDPGETDDEYKARVAKPYDDVQRAIERRPCDAAPPARQPRPPRPRRRDHGANEDGPPRHCVAPPKSATLSRAALAADVRTRADDPAADPGLAAIFGDGGTLPRALPGFRFRPQQLAMAEAVAARDRAARPRWSPKPAPAPARPSPISFPRCSTAAR